MKRRALTIAATAFVIGVFMLMSCGRDGRNGTVRDGAAAAKPQKQESAGKPATKAKRQNKTETKAEVKVEQARSGEARQQAQSASPIPEPPLQAKGKLVYYYIPG